MKPILQTLKNLNLTCRGAARLISDHSERPLTTSERLGLKLHLLICRSCRGYEKSVRFLQRIIGFAGTMESNVDATLPPESRERIRQTLREP